VRCARDGLVRGQDARAELAHLPRRLVSRILRKRILCFVWMDAEQIAKLPFDELDTRYWHHGLDLRERLAVWAALPKKLEGDAGAAPFVVYHACHNLSSVMHHIIFQE
jgi:hypothetical protein